MAEGLQEELEAVEAILMEGLDVLPDEGDNQSTIVKIRIDPKTACDDDKKYVALTLEMLFPKDYPDQTPEIKFRNPRGLSDESLEHLHCHLDAKCNEYLGCPVIFELIDACREFLTERNVPDCQCAICLFSIVDDDTFHKTSCFHYFHAHCLGRYVENALKSFDDHARSNQGSSSNMKESLILCPVCREPLDDIRTETWLKAPKPILESESHDFELTQNIKDLQGKMQKLYLKQKQKGGIIDVEAEEKKYLVSTATSPSDEQELEIVEEIRVQDERKSEYPNEVVQGSKKSVGGIQLRTPSTPQIHQELHEENDEDIPERIGRSARGRNVNRRGKVKGRHFMLKPHNKGNRSHKDQHKQDAAVRSNPLDPDPTSSRTVEQDYDNEVKGQATQSRGRARGYFASARSRGAPNGQRNGRRGYRGKAQFQQAP